MRSSPECAWRAAVCGPRRRERRQGLCGTRFDCSVYVAWAGVGRPLSYRPGLTLPDLMPGFRRDAPVSRAIIKRTWCRVRLVRSSNRSEEHTSELQSLRHLVCRLLLEKKKSQTSMSRPRPLAQRSSYRDGVTTTT